MNIEKEIELLKYQIQLLKTVIGGDSHPFHMYMLDHNITQDQHGLIMDILIVMNHRLSQKDDPTSKKFFEAKKEMIQSRLTKLQIDENQIELFSESIPTFKEFQSIIAAYLPSDINPKHLLMSALSQELCPTLCNHLLSQV
ncbi:hypothetical protein BC351_13245 [Paenibacillus ferrarius]|uniref:DUF1878 domain-containing protein n=1 Tax=Paenibacillus ferrarius TaxID=1469647 RepID=A0A1V4H7M4_9BACL|nr:hypothetical protein [Paenibacillus ferrarius]OPH46890.1 hypothetical protein BC351_13245 [Paenibacillus ferrarius]